MSVRGVRGATTCLGNTAEAILEATTELLQAVQAANPALRSEDIASAWFTLTPDLDAVHPARAARALGWTQVPLMCSQELPVPGSLPRCIRLLLHWNTDTPQSAIRHSYLRDALALRPDLAAQNPNARQEK